MRITLDIPESLIDEARRLLGTRSKTDAVILSLRALIRLKRVEEMRDLLGRVTLDVDVDRARGRRRAVRSLSRR